MTLGVVRGIIVVHVDMSQIAVIEFDFNVVDL